MIIMHSDAYDRHNLINFKVTYLSPKPSQLTFHLLYHH